MSAKIMAQMPDDYRPQTPARDFRFYRKDIELLQLVPDDEQGKAIIAAIEAADKYADTYDDAIIPDCTGFSKPAKVVCDVLFRGFKRGLEAYRQTSWAKSHANGGGTPAKTGDGDGIHPAYKEIEAQIREKGYTCTAQQFLARMTQREWTMIDGRPVNNTNWQSALLLFERGDL